ncbi:hypothetical protein HPB51_003917 [Rhipicephalus microplus]|uniref:PiggyBac transposable element-derived protein domain-containing protein n=1 Tax=Rhipicephalus microplus TaxID=6941 RepID=A0A9J6EQK3_RHIMP|nr:hypothetical protein HPB51_003917 [Rhipicephalus microplus]
MDLVADSMPVNRFKKIRRFLHFKDNSDTLSFQNDHVAGIRPVIDAPYEAFCSAVDPEEYQSVHEMVIPFKRCSSIKRYLPNLETTMTVTMKKRVFNHVSLEKRLDCGRHFQKKSEQKYASGC